MLLIKNSWGAALSYGLLALFVVLIILDVGSESEIKKVEEINEMRAIPAPELNQIPTKEIHVVQSGENLSVIFEKYKVTLNSTYQIFKADKTGDVKNLKPGDRLEFSFLDSKIQSIHIIKSPFFRIPNPHFA